MIFIHLNPELKFPVHEKEMSGIIHVVKETLDWTGKNQKIS